MGTRHRVETAQVERGEPVSASPKALPALRRVLSLLDDGPRAGHAQLSVGRSRASLPGELQHLLHRLVEVLARGDALSLIPVERELTTQQAADLLNVSRQYMATLLDAGEVPCSKTKGAHRRIKLEDLLAYKHRRDDQRARALSELTRLTEEYGGYPELKK